MPRVERNCGCGGNGCRLGVRRRRRTVSSSHRRYRLRVQCHERSATLVCSDRRRRELAGGGERRRLCRPGTRSTRSMPTSGTRSWSAGDWRRRCPPAVANGVVYVIGDELYDVEGHDGSRTVVCDHDSVLRRWRAHGRERCRLRRQSRTVDLRPDPRLDARPERRLWSDWAAALRGRERCRLRRAVDNPHAVQPSDYATP